MSGPVRPTRSTKFVVNKSAHPKLFRSPNVKLQLPSCGLPEDWSAAEVFTHILDMNDTGAAAIVGILDHGAVPGTTGAPRKYLPPSF